MKFANSLFPDLFLDEPRIKKRGHAGQPGNGPKNETCRTCEYYAHVRMANTYRKCGLNRQNWTGGPGSDIRAGDPACEFWNAA